VGFASRGQRIPKRAVMLRWLASPTTTLDVLAHLAILEIREGEVVRRALLRGDTIRIGRQPDCEIVLAAPWITDGYARLELVAGAHRLVVEAENAHVALGGQVVREVMLHDGDTLRLTDPVSSGQITLVYRNPLAAKIGPVHHFATPPGASLLTIGRADADIVLPQALVSRRHADLRWQDGKHVLIDKDSANGTFVNGERVQGSRALSPGDVVQIGTFQLTYDGDSLDSFDQHGTVRLDASAVERSVGAKQLLSPTTLSIEPCELVAIVGGSGAGKSTLMTALCGFQRASDGKIALNGDDLYAHYDAYRSIIGFVPQDDTLHRTLPVRRALHHAARLRLPSDTTDDEIEKRIASVLETVEMTDHAEKRIDQLSGGQRKRVSIACELLADPVLLFLDEPTSGLDPGLERKLMYTLRALADGGRTVIVITHATTNITICDHIAFLAGGKLSYFGPPSQALEYFEVTDFADIYTTTEGDGKAAVWAERYRASMQHQKYAVERPARAPAGPSIEQRAEAVKRARTFKQSSLRQLALLCRRYVELILADKKNLALLLLQAPVIGLLLTLVSKPDGLVASRIEAKKLIFMLATTGVWFGVINAAREICKESAVLRRERLAGLRAGPYLVSKLVVLYGLVLVQSALLLGVVAIRCKLPEDGIVMPAPLELFATIAFAGLAGIALGLCVSAIASTPDKATSLVPIVLVPQVLFAGIMFGLHGIPKLASYAVPARAAVDAMSATVDTNNLATPMFVPLPPEPQYAHDAATLLGAWGQLGAQALVFTILAWIVLYRRR
jgi:ABC-type multidrug transport system ATPase subunit